MEADVQDARNRRWDEPFGEKALAGDAVARILALPAFADVRAEDFPAWLPLDAIIANDGRIRRFARGDTIIRKDEYGSSLFVILEGSVVGLATPPATSRGRRASARRRPSWFRAIGRLLARRRPPEYRPRRRAERLRVGPAGAVREDIDALAARYPTFTLRAPEMFGELAALTRSPRSASIYAGEDDTLVFELRWQGLREIRDWSQRFRERIDQLYRERGLVARLRECPIFAHVDAEALDEIAAESLFETYGNFDWTHRFKSEIGRRASTSHIIEQEPLICAEGNHLDGLLLISNGFARVTKRVDSGERTVSHISGNDTFGLEEIVAASGMTLRASLRAIGYVDVIRIPTLLVQKYVLPGLPQELVHSYNETDATIDDRETMRQGMMDFFVDHRFINGQAAMVINLDRCVGCDDCVRACASAHNNNPRFVRHGYTYENAMVVNACMHCTDPVCLIGCPTGAIHREENTGTVIINDNTCIGCATCANSCPYNNIRMIDIRDSAGDFVLDRDGLAISRATKCDLCYDQLTGPACAQACPHDALTRVNIRDTKKLLQWLG